MIPAAPSTHPTRDDHVGAPLLQLRCPVRLCSRPNSSWRFAVELRSSLRMVVFGHNRLGINKLGCGSGQPLSTFGPVSALDAAIVFRVVSTSADAGKTV